MLHQSAWLKVQRLNFVENTEIRSIKCECSASRLIYKGFNSHITCQVNQLINVIMRKIGCSKTPSLGRESFFRTWLSQTCPSPCYICWSEWMHVKPVMRKFSIFLTLSARLAPLEWMQTISTVPPWDVGTFTYCTRWWIYMFCTHVSIKGSMISQSYCDWKIDNSAFSNCFAKYIFFSKLNLSSML